MKKLPALIVAMMIAIGVLGLPFASASTETGSGLTRTVQLEDPDWYTNATVVIPTVLLNSTNISFAFFAYDEANYTMADLNYTFNMSFEYNGTYYNKTVNVTVPPLGNETVWINYTADELPIGDDYNVNITMMWDLGWLYMDSWEGTVDLVDNTGYQISVILPATIMSLLAMGLMILFVVKILGVINKQIKEK